VITADMNVFDPGRQFDRIVSVEMFEHMMNWRELMTRVKSWLKPDGRFFMHIFTHRAGAYLFDRADGEDWIAQHFFTGGVMPSHHLIRQYADLFEVEKEWRWSGTHYQRTALDWLANFDAIATRSKHPAPGLWQRHRIVDAALALVLPRHRRPVRLRRRQRMGRQPLPDEGGTTGRIDSVVAPSFPERLQDLHQLGVDEFVAADHVAGLERIARRHRCR
jgi:SAM-dependent methyltransferase